MTKRLLLGALAALTITAATAPAAGADTVGTAVPLCAVTCTDVPVTVTRSATTVCVDYAIQPSQGGSGVCVERYGLTSACATDSSVLTYTRLCARASVLPATAIRQVCVSFESSPVGVARREVCLEA